MSANLTLDEISQLIDSKVREATDPLLAQIVDLTDQVQKLESTVSELTREVDDVNQQGRKDYLILDGDALPTYSEAENTRRVVVDTLKQQLDVTLPEADITACHRLQNKAKVIIRCKTRDQKDSIYSARMSQGNSRKTLYIRESLTPRRSAQVALLVELKKEGSISNFYTRNGVIFARKNRDMKYVKIEPGTNKAKSEELISKAGKADHTVPQASGGTISHPKPAQSGQQTSDGTKTTKPAPSAQTASTQQQRRHTRSTSAVGANSGKL